jgi:hypothetical protein
MSIPTTISAPVTFTRAAHGRRRMGAADQAQLPAPPGRVPRVARLMALAIRLEEQVRTRMLPSYSAIADLGHVSRARVSQILNLVNLAPDVQEALLFLPRIERGRDPIHLRLLQPIASSIDWTRQRQLWHDLIAARGAATSCAADGRRDAARHRGQRILVLSQHEQ